MKIRTRLCLVSTVLIASLLLASCGSGSPHTSPPVYYTVGGTVTKLVDTGGGLHLQNNGSDTLSVDANGTFTFATQVASGGTYNVKISAQPSAPAQTCGVTNGTGTVTSDVTNIVVDCGHNEWTWMSGVNFANQAGTYGTLGTAAAGNLPGSRFPAATWIDSSGNLWLFGGDGCDSNAACWGSLNDLWKYDGSQWTWMSGASVPERKGTYGTLGTAAPDNTPGARRRSAAWTDSTGNMFLFGGCGVDGNGLSSYLNDLWKYSNNQWTWMGGAEVGYQAGTYGTPGTASASNIPGARWGGACSTR